MKIRPLALLFAVLLIPAALRAWDYDGHRTVNQLALAALPVDFPAFVREPANAERIAFLAGEADRWRNVPDLPLGQASGLDHYFDVEQIPAAGLSLATLPALRYVFAAQFAAGRAAHPGNFLPIDEARNSTRSREWCGFLPWAITENYARLRAAFSYLKTFEELGTPEEIANAKANIVYVMGQMGHYVGDSAQPLHTTMHDHGWAGPNPRGYSTWPGIHSWIDSGFINKAGIKLADLAPRVTPAVAIPLAPREDGRDAIFVATLDFIVEQNQLVEPLYQLEQAHKFSHAATEVPTPEARAFIEKQLLAGSRQLAAIWLTAWKNPVPDTFLRSALLKRAAAAAPAKDGKAAKKPRVSRKKTPASEAP